MLPDGPTGPVPTAAARTPEAKLIRNVRELCVRIVRGKAAAQNGSVRLQRALGIASILLSSLGSVGVIADKAGRLPDQTGWAFWGSVILLVFGILSQIANQFRVAQRAADSEALSIRCGLYETRLTDILMDEDPQTAVADLFVEVSAIFQTERYHVVLPVQTHKIKNDAKKRSDDLIALNREFWQLKVVKQKGVTKPPPSPSAPPAGPPADPDRREDT